MIGSICQSVATAIAAKAASDTPFAQSLTATYEYLPEQALATMSGINVYVTPSAQDSTLATRDGDEDTDYSIDVIVTKHLASPSRTPAWKTEIDGLLTLVESIASEIRMVDADGAEWKRNTVSPVYDTKRLKDENVFLSVIRATYWKQE